MRSNQKVSLNMVGGGFQHDICSTALNKNIYVEWDKSGHKSNISIHIDWGILNIPVNSSKINFGWINESTPIIPGVINSIASNLEYYRSKFELIFTYDRRLIDKDSSFFKYAQPPASPWIQNKKMYKKTKLISFIGSSKVMCNGHRYRQQIINKYRNKVSHYGRGFGDKELPWTIDTDDGIESGKILGLKDYMYSIVMENGIYDDYYCEKITDCFATGTIPIYWGTRQISKFFDVDGVLFLDDIEDLSVLNEELYNQKLKHVKNNLEIVKKMNTSEDFIYLNYIKDYL